MLQVEHRGQDARGDGEEDHEAGDGRVREARGCHHGGFGWPLISSGERLSCEV